MSGSPRDDQERETIARIIDEEAYTFRPWNENWRLAMANRQQDALAKADTILALRSNPQPGSEGKPVAWRTKHADKDWFPWSYFDDESEAPFYLTSKEYITEPLFTASPTPPTAQPGEVERLRSALGPALKYLEQQNEAHQARQGVQRRDLLDIIEPIRAALTPSESQEA